MPSSSVYKSRFSSLVRAYHLIGYTPDRDYAFIEVNRQLRQLHPKVITEMVERITRLGGVVVQDPKTDLLTVNGEFTASLVVARCRRTESGSLRWSIRLDTGLAPDITVAARMDEENKAPLDYYLLPAIDINPGKLLLAQDNGVGLGHVPVRYVGLFLWHGATRQNSGGSMTEAAPTAQMIPIAQINILNPRSRNKATFQDIVSNISNVGLKKPITVARREQPSDGKLYDLACGEGRLEAYIALGQTEIPAIVTEATKEDCFLMSLVENLARRPHAPLELMREINNLKSRGYNTTEIAKKIDLAKSYVIGIAHLLDHGEDRLLAAVDKGRVPLSVAMQISNSDDAGIQQALCDAYENKTLRGRKLLTVRKIIEQRKDKGQAP